MSARSALVPKYCLHKPSGGAYVRIRGKVVYVGQYGSANSKEEYGRLVVELAASGGTAIPSASATGLTVVELIAGYLDYAEGYYRKNGQPTRSLDNIKRAIKVAKDL